MPANKVTGRDVINFFNSADLELASLVLEFATKSVGEREEKAGAIRENLKKARAARKPKGEVATTEVAATATED